MFSVIFEVHPGEGRKDDYLALAKDMKPILESIEGFIDNERFESRTRPGWVLSHSTWRDEKSLIRWRKEARHHLTQEKGRFSIFSDYHLRVGEITADDRPPAGLAVLEQRFDTTEIGRAKYCTLTELTPPEDGGLPATADALLRDMSLAAGAPGLVEHDIFDSIYAPGKVMVIGSWAEATQAENFEPARPSAAETMRQRVVRVIRDYGRFDRRETPQYYPDVERDRT